MPSVSPVPSLDRLKAKSERIKLWGGILAMVLGNVVALTTAILAHFKEETGAKNVYRELSGAIEKVSDDQVQLHKDVAAIRGYLAGQAQQKPMVLWSPKEKDKDQAKPERRLMPPIRIGVAKDGKTAEEPVAVIPPPQAPPPNITPEPQSYKPRPVDAVVEKK